MRTIRSQELRCDPLLAVISLTAICGLGCSDAQGDIEPSAQIVASRSQALADSSSLHATQGCADHDHASDDPKAREHAAHRVRWVAPQHHPSRTKQVKLLTFNDFHGQLGPRSVGGRTAGGAAVLASYLEAAQTGFEGRSLIIHAGDHVGASPPQSALLQDEPSIQFLNMLTNGFCTYRHPAHPRCNVVGTLGNHEFDEGSDEMLRLIDGGNHPSGPFLEDPYRGARYAYVSSNVISEETGETLLEPYVVKELGGVRLGVIGAVLKETPTIVTPTGVAGLEFLDEAEAINRSVRKLRRRGVHSIVVTIHQGGRQTLYEGPTQPDGEVTGPITGIVQHLDDEVDVVVSGHSHSFTNALLPNQNGTEILVTQAFSASTAYGDILLDIDRQNGDVTAKSAEIVTTYGDQAPGDSPDPEVAELVQQADTLTAPLVNQIVGEAAQELTRTENEAGESELGNLIADAQRAAMGTDFAFMNPGGIRADLDAGPITWGELFTIQPFGNSLVQMTLTGEQIVQLLEQQWVGQSFPRILKTSGLSYVWDANQPDGQRIVEVLDGDGNPLQPSAEYTVTVNSFLAAGGDNFTVLTQGTGLVGGPVDLDALIEFIDQAGGPIVANIEGRISLL